MGCATRRLGGYHHGEGRPAADQRDRRSALIPVARPLLPVADALLPYLRRIDEARIYSNFGPLVQQLEARLAAHLGAPEGGVVSAVNGTAALTACLLAVTGGEAGLCVMPSWTFPATAHAAMGANLTPVFVDVDRHRWRLDPATAREALRRWPGVRAVIPVGAFGLPVDTAAWDRFADETGCPVVIDAAAGFAGQKIGAAPVVISLHATKVLGAGEGALVATREARLAAAVRQTLNFGFPGRRAVESRGLNGKMSEYSAAAALVALDNWPKTWARWSKIGAQYGAALEQAGAHARRPDPELVTSTFVCEVPASAEQVQARLEKAGIDSRLWYNRGCHRETAFQAFPRGELEATEQLTARCIGLPMFLDITEAEIATVARSLAAAVAAEQEGLVGA